MFTLKIDLDNPDIYEAKRDLEETLPAYLRQAADNFAANPTALSGVITVMDSDGTGEVIGNWVIV